MIHLKGATFPHVNRPQHFLMTDMIKLFPFLLSVIKGKVLLIDEENTVLSYVVEVLQIIQQGDNDLKITKEKIIPLNKEYEVIDLVKREACKSPKLKQNNEYLFMGLDKGGKYELDKTSFVKLWPTEPNDTDKKKLDDFARLHKCTN